MEDESEAAEVPDWQLPHILGAQGVATLWLASSCVLGHRPITAVSGLTHRSAVATEMLILVNGFQAQASCKPAHHRNFLRSCSRLVLTAEICMGISMAVGWLSGKEAAARWKTLTCLLFLRPWLHADPDCPDEPVWLIMALLPSWLLHAFVTRYLLSRVANGSTPGSCLGALCLCLWFAAALPELLLAFGNGGWWLWRSQALPTWFWPPALAADFAMGACAGSAAQGLSPRRNLGILADLSILVVFLLLWLAPLSEGEILADSRQGALQFAPGPLAARAAAPALALLLFAGSERTCGSRVARLLAHPSLVALSACSWEAYLLAAPLRDLCNGPLKGWLQLDSAPGYVAYFLLLWLLAGLLSGFVTKALEVQN
ncbi:unnamed protein product [Polarella glacialis]|uniref:Uncharacterized protein n=1 Tax=Polarella glacialis TaxID=89957 RepID=A0A813EDY5_POLGL|nr:unnamed protein product [Polarella glacialis]